MPPCNFSLLVERVRSGRKLQTIRPHRCGKRGCNHTLTGSEHHKTWYRPLDDIWLFTGLRTKNCEALGVGKIEKVPVRPFRHITHEDAVTDGFEDGHQADLCDTPEWQKYCDSDNREKHTVYRHRKDREDRAVGPCECSALSKVTLFLEKQYAPSSQTLFELPQWKKLETSGKEKQNAVSNSTALLTNLPDANFSSMVSKNTKK